MLGLEKRSSIKAAYLRTEERKLDTHVTCVVNRYQGEVVVVLFHSIHQLDLALEGIGGGTCYLS